MGSIVLPSIINYYLLLIYMGFINWTNAMHKLFYLLFIYLSDCLYICMDFMEDRINLNLNLNPFPRRAHAVPLRV